MAAAAPSYEHDERILLRAEEDTAPQTTLELMRRVGPLMVVSALFHIFMMLEIHVYMPYLYTRVRCCAGGHDLPGHFDITDGDVLRDISEEASRIGVHFDQNLHLEACSVPHFPRDSSLWSMSPHCPNKAFVQQTAQSTMAVMKPLQKIFCFLVLPIGGALADSVGRKFVLAVYGIGLVLGCLLSAWDAFSESAHGDWVVYVAGCLFGFSFQPKDSMIASVVSDVMVGNGPNTGRALVAMRGFDLVFSIAVNSALFFYLRQHNSNHYGAWLAFAGVAGTITLLIAGLVPETLPARLRSKPTLAMLVPGVAHVKALSYVAGDAVLAIQAAMMFLFYAYFLGFLTTRTSYLTLIGWKLEEVIVPEIISPACALLFTFMLIPLFPTVGEYNLSTIGNALFAAGYCFIGPFALLVSPVGPYISGVLFALAIVVIFPAFQTIISQRISQEHLGKAQGAIFSLGTLGAVVGIPVYNRVLFDSTSSGIWRATCPMASLALALLCTLLSLVVTLLARRSSRPSYTQVAPVISLNPE